MNKSIYIGLSILELSKIVMCNQKWKKAKLCYLDTDRFFVYLNTDDIKKIAEDLGKRFDTSNYELDRQLTKEKNKKVIGLKKNKSGEKII